jgi:hypothetical protein
MRRFSTAPGPVEDSGVSTIVRATIEWFLHVFIGVLLVNVTRGRKIAEMDHLKNWFFFMYFKKGLGQ